MSVLLSSLQRVFLLLAIGSLACFFGLSLLIDRGGLRTTDFTLTVKLQDRFPQRLDDNVGILVDLASMEIQGIIILIVVALLPLRKREKILLLALYTIGLALVLVGKNVLHHPAPPFLFQRTAAGLPFPSMHVQVDYSYPSGHTYRIAFLSVVLLATGGLRRSWPLILGGSLTSILAAFIMFGLIVLGKHWTTDIIGAATLAIGLALLPYYFFAKR